MFALAGLLAFLSVKAAQLASGRWPMLLAGLLALGALAFGLYEFQRARDRSVKVVLDSKGFRDRRAGNVLVPWADVREVRYHSMRNLKIIAFTLDGPVPPGIRYSSGASAFAMAMPWADATTARMDVTYLDWSGPDILAAVRNFAPHAKVEG